MSSRSKEREVRLGENLTELYCSLAQQLKYWEIANIEAFVRHLPLGVAIL